MSLPSASSLIPWLPDLLKQYGFLLSNVLSILLATEFVWQLVGSAFLQSYSDPHSGLNFLKDQSMQTGSFLSPVSASSRLACGPHRSIEAKFLGRLEKNIPPFFVTQCTNARPTVIVGLFLQQAIALFVLKTGAGFSIFSWIVQLAADFLGQAHVGAVFFFDESATRWFFVGVVGLIAT